jgi:hypothetical protein
MSVIVGMLKRRRFFLLEMRSSEGKSEKHDQMRRQTKE